MNTFLVLSFVRGARELSDEVIISDMVSREILVEIEGVLGLHDNQVNTWI